MTLLSTFALILWLFTGQGALAQTGDTRVLASTKDWTITAQDFETSLVHSLPKYALSIPSPKTGAPSLATSFRCG